MGWGRERNREREILRERKGENDTQRKRDAQGRQGEPDKETKSETQQGERDKQTKDGNTHRERHTFIWMEPEKKETERDLHRY